MAHINSVKVGHTVTMNHRLFEENIKGTVVKVADFPYIYTNSSACYHVYVPSTGFVTVVERLTVDNPDATDVERAIAFVAAKTAYMSKLAAASPFWATKFLTQDFEF